MSADRKDVVRRLKAYSVKDTKTRCRNWTAGKKNGYARIKVGGKDWYAHRMVYEMYVGEIPSGMTIHHTCANSICVNVNHLQMVTQSENIAEMRERQYYLKRIEQLEEKVEKYEQELSKANR